MHIPQLDGGSIGEISRPLPMESEAGWYVGSVYWDSTCKSWLPNARSTHYVESRRDAQKLMSYEAVGLEDLSREHGYEAGELADAYRMLDELLECHEFAMRWLDAAAYRAGEDLIEEVDATIGEAGLR